MLGEINIIAVIAATLGSFFVGFLWYGVLFTKPWMKATGMKKDDRSTMGKQIIQNQAFNIIGIAVFYYILKYAGISEISEIIKATILLWGAFCVPAIIPGIIWEKRPFSLGAINSGAFLVQSLVAGLILSNWL